MLSFNIINTPSSFSRIQQILLINTFTRIKYLIFIISASINICKVQLLKILLLLYIFRIIDLKKRRTHFTKRCACFISNSPTVVIQQFWALPILSIVGLHIRHIMGYCILLAIWIGIVTSILIYFVY
ncbi:TIGR00366 family protein [Bacillus sp. JJ1562]|uniref:TIGR00366 family protein n=1 Tax=Bacillus sp. JJ1562 TaxID=3122960 RepID=UPI003002B3F8